MEGKSERVRMRVLGSRLGKCKYSVSWGRYWTASFEPSEENETSRGGLVPSNIFCAMERPSATSQTCTMPSFGVEGI
jgi:hypothetical protein